MPAMDIPRVAVPMRDPDVEIRRPDVREDELIPRRLYIKTKDIEKFGATERCKGCVAILRGGQRVAHSEACRKRLTEAIAESEEGQARIEAAENRALEYQDRILEAREQQGQKKKAKTEPEEARVLEHGCRNLQDQPEAMEDQPEAERAEKRGHRAEEHGGRVQETADSRDQARW